MVCVVDPSLIVLSDSVAAVSHLRATVSLPLSQPKPTLVPRFCTVSVADQ